MATKIIKGNRIYWFDDGEEIIFDDDNSLLEKAVLVLDKATGKIVKGNITIQDLIDDYLGNQGVFFSKRVSRDNPDHWNEPFPSYTQCLSRHPGIPEGLGAY